MVVAVQKPGHPFGIHRVLEPRGVLPQQAQRVHASLPIFDNEILIEVDALNIDSASFRQMSEATGGTTHGIASLVEKTVLTRGKQHNPVTGSGGMLLGTVAEVGSKYRGDLKVAPGDRIATLVSLSLTPLSIRAISSVEIPRERVNMSGHAILFESGIAALIPPDLSEDLVLSVLDVAGAPAGVARLAQAGQTIVILGGAGKSGTLAAAAARDKVGREGRVLGIDFGTKAHDRMRASKLFDEAFNLDCTQSLLVHAAIDGATRGRGGDLVVNCTNVPGAEMAAILCARRSPDAIVLLFSMATSFTAAALGAEGVGHPATLMIGNGYVPGHAALALNLVRNNPTLARIFERQGAA